MLSIRDDIAADVDSGVGMIAVADERHDGRRNLEREIAVRRRELHSHITDGQGGEASPSARYPSVSSLLPCRSVRRACRVTTPGRSTPPATRTWAGRGPRRSGSCTPRAPPLPAAASRASAAAWRMACAVLFRQASSILHPRRLSARHMCCTLPIHTTAPTGQPTASAAGAPAARRRQDVDPTRAAPRRQPSARHTRFRPRSTRTRREGRPGSRTCTRAGERSGTGSRPAPRHHRSRARRSPGTCRTSPSAGRWCTWSDA